jgi:glycosyltransferase involved in cell wall biosynthesis
MTEQGRVLFLAWTRTSGRAQDIAGALDGEAVLVFPHVPLLKHPLSTVVRYLLSIVQTALVLVRRRPSAVVVTNPPLLGPLVVAAWSRVTGRPFVLDSHPAGFGLKGKAVLARLQGVHRFLARRAAGVLVTTDEKAAEVDGWGANGIVVHEAPVPFPPAQAPEQPVVLFVGIFATDEPVDVVVEAARLLPDVTFQITGDPTRAPRGLVEGSPPNVAYVGFLGTDDYRSAVSAASLLLTLTTEPSSVMRSAYEGVYARVPLVMTGTDVLRATFPFAVFCDNTGPSIAEAVTEALTTRDALVAKAEQAAEVQSARWDAQLALLRKACGQ